MFFTGTREMTLGLLLVWLLYCLVTVVRRPGRRSRLAFIGNNVLMITAIIVTPVLAVISIRADVAGSLVSERNFYGVVSVVGAGEPGAGPDRTLLVNGITIHGMQYADAGRHDTPTMFYSETSGAGLALQNYPREGRGLRVGVLGLGIGTLAAYSQPGDVFRFYEINPTVIRLAEGEGGYFTFLSDARASVEVVPGDARLSLEAELAGGGSQAYDVLVLDVFSSDSIPVHLLDVEAFDLYLRHLQPDGVVALHISNRHLDLVPVAWTLARHFDLSFVLIEDRPVAKTASPSQWVLLSRDLAVLALPAIQSRAAPMDGYTTDIRLWTDDYSNLFAILK